MSGRKQLFKEVELLMLQEGLASISGKDDGPSSQVDFDQSQSTLLRDTSSDIKLHESVNVGSESLEELEDIVAMANALLRTKYRNLKKTTTSEEVVDSDGHTGRSANYGSLPEPQRTNRGERGHQDNSTNTGGQEGQDNQQSAQGNPGQEDSEDSEENGEDEDDPEENGESWVNKVITYIHIMRGAFALWSKLPPAILARAITVLDSCALILSKYDTAKELTEKELLKMLKGLEKKLPELTDILNSINHNILSFEAEETLTIDTLRKQLDKVGIENSHSLEEERDHYQKIISKKNSRNLRETNGLRYLLQKTRNENDEARKEYDEEVKKMHLSIEDLEERLHVANRTIRMLKDRHPEDEQTQNE